MVSRHPLSVGGHAPREVAEADEGRRLFIDERIKSLTYRRSRSWLNGWLMNTTATVRAVASGLAVRLCTAAGRHAENTITEPATAGGMSRNALSTVY